MRPEKAYRIVSVAIEAYLEGNKNLLYNSLPALEKLMQKDKLSWKTHEWGEYDTRDPYELMGYHPDFIMVDMDYISGKFRAAHRLNWLIAGVKDNRF